MPGRSSAKNHCGRCRMYHPICLCSLIPQFVLSTRIVVLMHWRENNLTTGTANLACLALPNSQILLRGLQGNPLSTAGLVPNEGSAALLFPSPDSQELSPEIARGLPRPLTLIVPDGSWGQARKVALREPALRHLPRFRLPPGPLSEYRLRHSPHPEGLSTFEAITRALAILEQERGAEMQPELEHLFRTMVERRLWSKGKLRPEDCRTGIPKEALQASHRAGAGH